MRKLLGIIGFTIGLGIGFSIWNPLDKYVEHKKESTQIDTNVTTEEEQTHYEIKFPNLRVAKGIWHENLTIETEDGNLWTLKNEPDERYFKPDNTQVFSEGEEIIVLFDIMKSMEVYDDIVLDVHSLEY